MKKLKNLFFIILLFLPACASKEIKTSPACSALTNVAFDTTIQSKPTTIIYQNSNCEDITHLYGSENEKVFFLQIRDDIYQNNLYSTSERYTISKSNVMFTYKKIGGKPVLIFESSMFGAIYAFSAREGMPNLSEITYPKGYIPQNGEIIAEIENNKIIFKTTQDIPNIGGYGLYTLKKDSQIEISFNY